MRVAAAILAAGQSSRAGFDKTLAILGGRPVWKWSCDIYSAHESVDQTIVVGSIENRITIEGGGAKVVLGGDTRQESARRALDNVSADVLLLHDAARPFVSPQIITDVIAAISRSGAAAAATPVVDTIKEISENGVRTLDRSRLVSMQTPQGARVELLLEAYARSTVTATDDVALLEAIGVQPEIVKGDPANFKITTAEDLERARAVAGEIGRETRVGFGYDVHAFSPAPGRLLMLGGVAFPGHPGLEGHSDADVLIHAAVDALLGAACLGDIGKHFPNTDAQWKDAPSLSFLNAAAGMLRAAGWSVSNLDMTLIAESPKISARAPEIIACLAAALAVSTDRISVKATTNERLGFIGRGEGIAATATCCLRKSG